MKFNIKTKRNEELNKENLSNLISEIHKFQEKIRDNYGIALEANIKIEVNY